MEQTYRVEDNATFCRTDANVQRALKLLLKMRMDRSLKVSSSLLNFLAPTSVASATMPAHVSAFSNSSLVGVQRTIHFGSRSLHMACVQSRVLCCYTRFRCCSATPAGCSLAAGLLLYDPEVHKCSFWEEGLHLPSRSADSAMEELTSAAAHHSAAVRLRSRNSRNSTRWKPCAGTAPHRWHVITAV